MKKQQGSRRRAYALLAFTICSAFLFAPVARAQFSEQILKVTTGTYAAGTPLTVTVDFMNLTGIGSVDIYYRLFGQGTYTRREMEIRTNSAVYAIPPGELQPAILEYYFVIHRSDNRPEESYPVLNPEAQPLTADLGPSIPEARGITVLSPEPGEHVNRDDILISFSLMAGDSVIDGDLTRIYLDDEDLTAKRFVSDDLFILSPETAGFSVDGGTHTVRVVLFDRDGNLFSEKTWDFFVRGARLADARGPGETHEWTARSSVRLESRNETVSDVVTPYNRATVDVRATDGRYVVTGSAHLTNEEKDTRQPQNRFYIGAESPWVKLGYGDTYPVMPDMIISGKRVRGFNGSLSAGFFDFDVVAGDIARSVEGDTIRTFPADSLPFVDLGNGSYAPYDTTVIPNTWAQYRPGTPDRNLLILRPSFRFGSGVFGLSALHSKDDISSVRTGRAPEENLVVGSDLALSFDRRNIELRTQAAFSLYNGNIAGGTISDEKIDSIFADDRYESFSRSDLVDARDFFSRFITVNENFVPLGAKNVPTLSWEGNLSVNYEPNVFSFTYLRHGASYESFGQPFYRKDIRGVSVNDRLKLADNRLQISAGFESLKDNMAETKAATTTFTTVSGTVTYLSRSDVPNITVGVLSLSNTNPLAPDDISARDDNTLRFMAQLSRQFNAGGRHFASLTLSTSNRDDATARNLDSRNTSVSLNVSSNYGASVQTTVSAMYFSTELDLPGSASRDLDYTILLFSSRYRTPGNRLLLNATVSPTLGDISRTLLDGGAQYFFIPMVSLEGKLSVYINDGSDSDVIWSFILRADF